MTVQVTSVSDLISLLSIRNGESLSSALSSLLKNLHTTSSNAFQNYLLSESEIPHIMRLFPMVMQSSVHEFMANVLMIAGQAIVILMKQGKKASALNLSKIIVNDHAKAIYRCLSSGNALCLVASCELLNELIQVDVTIPAVLVTTFDLTHKGFQKASTMRKPMEYMTESISPRSTFCRFLSTLLKSSDFETKMILSKFPFMVHYFLDTCMQDTPESLQSILTCIREEIVFNEQEKRNLPVAFLKSKQMSQLAKLLSHKNPAVQNVTLEFVTACFATPNAGMAYPVEKASLSVLRNKLLMDLINDLDVLNGENAQELLCQVAPACPDVAWQFVCQCRSLEPVADTKFYVAVSLAARLLSMIPFSTDDKESLVPRSMSRALLSRALNHEDLMVAFNTLLMILAILQRFGGELTVSQTLMAKSLLPDFKSLYNSWHQRKTDKESEEGQMLYRCFLEVFYQYLSNGLGDASCTLKAQEIWSPSQNITDDDGDSDVASSALRLCSVMDPITLLASDNDVKLISDLLSKAPHDEACSTLSTWIRSTGISEFSYEELLNVQFVQILKALKDIHSIPLLFPEGVDPLTSYLSIDPTSIIRKPVIAAIPVADMPVEGPPSKKAKTKEIAPLDLQKCISDCTPDTPVTFIISILSMVKRKAVTESFSRISPDTTIVMEASTMENYVDGLIKFSFSHWINALAAAVSHPDSHTLDLRLLIESGILGYAVIGLSLTDEGVRRASHFILLNYCRLLEGSHLKERRQLSLILSSLAGNQTPEDPIAILPRLSSYFHANALPVMLFPDHPMYRPLNEMFLASPIIPPSEFFKKLFFDANDEWSRELHWVLSVFRDAAGLAGQNVETCRGDLEGMHFVENVSILLLQTGVEGGCRTIASNLLQILRKDWSTLIE